MDTLAARRIGSKQACKTVFFASIIFEFIWLLVESRGDFANGLIFFIHAQANVVVIIFFALLFIITYFLGRRAGIDIVINGKDYIRVGLINAFLTSILIISYLLIIYYLHNVLKDALRAILQIILAVTAPMISVWLYSVKKIKALASL